MSKQTHQEWLDGENEPESELEKERLALIKEFKIIQSRFDFFSKERKLCFKVIAFLKNLKTRR